MLRARALCALAVVLTALALAGSAGAAPRAPAEGLYDSCAGVQLQTVCIEHLEAMRRAGFTVVLNYTALTYSDPAEVRTYAAAANALGMKVIWALESPVWWTGDASQAFPEMSGAYHTHTNAALLRHLVDLVKRSPATWGYYVGDETEVSQAEQANAFSAEVHRDDPHHPRLFVGIGYGAQRLIRPFASQADVLGADIYPVGQNQPPSLVGQIAARLRAIARPGQRTAMVLQSFGWPTSAGRQVWPTERQMHAMLGDAAAAHPSLILWWAYYEILQSRTPARHWSALRDAVFGRSSGRSAGVARQLSLRLSKVPDLPAAAARALATSDPYPAPQLTSGGFLEGFLRGPTSAVSITRSGRATVGAVGCLTQCTISVRYVLLGRGRARLLGATTFSLRPDAAQSLSVTVRGRLEADLATFVTARAGGRSGKGALYETPVRRG